MSASELVRSLDRLPRVRVLVLGDLMLDRYTWGTANRLSQEAPVVVLQADRSESRLGGAANTANMAAGLEAFVSVIGVVGNDREGSEILSLLASSHIEHSGVIVDNTRPTTVKERFIGRAGNRQPNQILRVDREVNMALSTPQEDLLLQNIAAQLPKVDVLLASDYGKGVCTPRLIRRTIELAREHGVPVLVDPAKGVDFQHYAGASLLKPNRTETEVATGRKIASRGDALEAGQDLCKRYRCEHVVVTLDSDGIALVDRMGHGRVYPCQTRSVYDITGAGDIVMAMLGVCLAAGVSADDAVQLSNVAGGLEVERTGVAVITRDEIRSELERMHPVPKTKLFTLAEARQLVHQNRAAGASVVFTNGCFDILHVGHATYLADAAAQGDLLLVGLNSDNSVRGLKGPSRPVIGQADRAAMLAALGCVDGVVIFDEETPQNLIEAIRPDVLVKGADYTGKEVVGQAFVESYGGRVYLSPVVPGVSTTEILSKIDKPRLRIAG